MHKSGRLRLRPWLEEQIESGKYPGVTWLDQSAQIFQIPWRHAARHGWSIDQDATLFRGWAMHTGRYRLGRDKPEPKTWKANFRCALNSLTDVCELQDRSRKRGHLASRVYRMLPRTTLPRTTPRTYTHNTGTQLSVGDAAGRTFVAAGRTNETQAIQPTPASPSSSTNPDPAERSAAALELWGGRGGQQQQAEAVFKELKTPKTGSGTDGGEKTAATWQYFVEMDEVLGARPSIRPPMIIASCTDPITLLMLMDHLNTPELWDQPGEQNGWRAYTQRNHWHCDSEDFLQTLYSDIYPCWTESSDSIGQQHYDKGH